MTIQDKFLRLATDNAPGQEVRQSRGADFLRGEPLDGPVVDFSHGDVDAHAPTPGAFQAFAAGVEEGGAQAYTEYRGRSDIRETLAARLADFTGAPVDAADGLIITPGTQGALFLAVASTVARGDKVAIVQPDYFANRKLVEFFEGEMVPVRIACSGAAEHEAGLNLDELEAAFRDGAKLFLFSNPNNPAGVVYSAEEIDCIAALAARYGATVIVDQLYSRLLYQGASYTHLRANRAAENVVTIMGPSKTESLSGYRLGVAFGPAEIIARMEKLQAIVSLRAAGYAQAVLRTWFNEPEGWMADRIRRHQAIRDDLVALFRDIPGCSVRVPQAGSYLFPGLPALSIRPAEFVKALRLHGNVIVTPGTEFSPQTPGSVRLNFSQDHAAAVSAVKRIAALVDRYRA
ncbi:MULTISPECIES: pyridoxal phosphate-dependent aminotransferase [unclassified Paracoccus (in: a-proteobacteria)]|uniref:pyridoxal phosphate-dependent aminotransferase n=1 Tax=unclassified Paracoccus (in: a-proteobacteria) TaxID=2688777 RepID=UPI0016035781|nr:MULTISPECIES: pyridoxal phosphate-dependent aminotransferase [unclassified Paracoccus (in: a-proteobacteria)]MBB1490694.1 pyridoxal phosphate-dependent aminotransferase [Paracoccus sp. MC1854]MBB1497463.1 pyridoxal phosphate-dependent aminotransferase [Paracoccus sp. MC1862]QQO45941.1 pyridoxal phosphate-dependent aminotransferase [Paracoccus sp. MC1862]